MSSSTHLQEIPKAPSLESEHQQLARAGERMTGFTLTQNMNAEYCVRWEQTGIILHTVNHTVVSSGLVHKSTPVNGTLPSHKSHMTTYKHDSRQKGFYICALSRQWVTLAV